MGLSAFNGQPGLRTAALVALAAQIDAGRLTDGSFSWDGKSGSVAGCLTQSADPQHWVDRFGLPRWLAYAFDAITAKEAPAAALDLVTKVLTSIRVASDTDSQGSLVICVMLDNAINGFCNGVDATAMANVWAAVRSLHERCRQADRPSGNEWRLARKQTMQLTDGLTLPGQNALAACIEASAWDPLTSHTTVAEVVRQWINLKSLDADIQFGWTSADHDHIKMLLADVHVEHVVNKGGETRDVFQLLELYHPDDARRLRGRVRFAVHQRSSCAELAATRLADALRSAA